MHCWWLLLFAQFAQLTSLARPELPPDCNQFEWKWQPRPRPAQMSMVVDDDDDEGRSRAKIKKNHNQKRVAFSIIPVDLTMRRLSALSPIEWNAIWYDMAVSIPCYCMVYTLLYGVCIPQLWATSIGHRPNRKYFQIHIVCGYGCCHHSAPRYISQGSRLCW